MYITLYPVSTKCTYETLTKKKESHLLGDMGNLKKGYLKRIYI